MPTRHRNLPDHEYEARLAWLQVAVKEAFDALDRGEGIEIENIDEFVNQAIAEGRAARKLASKVSRKTSV